MDCLDYIKSHMNLSFLNSMKKKKKNNNFRWTAVDDFGYLASYCWSSEKTFRLILIRTRTKRPGQFLKLAFSVKVFIIQSPISLPEIFKKLFMYFFFFRVDYCNSLYVSKDQSFLCHLEPV